LCHQELNKAQCEKKESIVILPGPYIQAVIDSISEKLLTEMNAALKENIQKYKDKPSKSVYWHEESELCEFTGFIGKQLRLRPKGTLGIHIDRSSAKITVLIYLNKKWEGGEFCAHLFPPQKKYDQQTRSNIHGNATVKKVIEPKGNRLVAFWSDSVPHEVLEIKSPRCSFQVFFSSKAK